jgi:hypothetical protein
MATWLVLSGGNVHKKLKDRNPAFQEGFAEFAEDYLIRQLFNSSSDKRLPYNRKRMYDGIDHAGNIDAIQTIEDGEKYCQGWRSFFHMLSTLKLHYYTFGTKNDFGGSDQNFINKQLIPGGISSTNIKIPGNTKSLIRYDSPYLEFHQILQSFMPDKKADVNVLNPAHITFRDFLNRVLKITGKITDNDIEAYLKLINPLRTEQPADLFKINETSENVPQKNFPKVDLEPLDRLTK